VCACLWLGEWVIVEMPALCLGKMADCWHQPAAVCSTHTLHKLHAWLRPSVTQPRSVTNGYTGMHPAGSLVALMQAEPRAALSLASREASHMLKIMPTDRVLYSAKVIPGNDTRVVKMLNSLSAQGATVVQGRSENLHVSGHAYQDELAEVLQLVKPQHFLPVHGEYSFLCEHAQLARERAGVQHTSVIKNGTMLGVHSLLSRNQFGKTSSLASVVGEANLVNFYNDGNKGTGTAQEMAIAERTTMAFEGMVVLALDINRAMGTNLAARCRLTTRGMWTDQGKLLAELYDVAEGVVGRMSRTASLALVERQVRIPSMHTTCSVRPPDARAPKVM